MFTRQANWLKIAAISPLKKMVLRFNKTEFPSPKNALCQVWLKLSKWFWRRSFCLLFHYSLPMEKSLTFYLKKLEFPSPNDTVCKVWVKLAYWFWRKVENVKSIQKDRQTDRPPKTGN